MRRSSGLCVYVSSIAQSQIKRRIAVNYRARHHQPIIIPVTQFEGKLGFSWIWRNEGKLSIVTFRFTSIFPFLLQIVVVLTSPWILQDDVHAAKNGLSKSIVIRSGKRF